MSAIIVIPARLHSTRLPKKLIKNLDGIPVLQHTWNRVKQMTVPCEVLIATDSEEIKEKAEGWGANVVMTDPECSSGTERIASILDHIDQDFIINVQGDEPFIDPQLLDRIYNCWKEKNAQLVTAVYKIKTTETLFNPNSVKVARTDDGRALYFSRSPIPFFRGLKENEWLTHATYWGHIGIYGYTKNILNAYKTMEISSLEKIESLEQLRFLNAGYNFQLVEAEGQTIAIDTQEDFDIASELLLKIKTS